MIEVHFQVSLLRSCVEFPSTRFFFPPFCPLKALCVSNPFNLPSLSLSSLFPSEHSGRLFAHPSLLSPRLSLYIFTSAT